MAATCVILAAGAGTRLGELGRQYSKPMVPLAGHPLVAWVIERLRAAGSGDIIVVGHPSDHQLAEFVAARHPDIQFALQPERRGIAEALRHALPFIAAEQAYLACACDSLFAPDDIRRLIDRGERHRGAAVVAVEDRGAAATARRSAVRLDGERVIEIIEKPPRGTVASGLVAAPLYWLPRAVDAYLSTGSGGESYVSTALHAFLHAGGTVLAAPIDERIEITTAADAARADARLR